MVVLGYYLGLLIFALNGILLMGLYNKYYELKVREQQIMRLLIKLKRSGRRI